MFTKMMRMSSLVMERVDIVKEMKQIIVPTSLGA